jgi:hypothetical protein
MVGSCEVVVRHLKIVQSNQSSVAASLSCEASLLGWYNDFLFRSINESNGITTDLALSKPVHVPASVLGQRG